MSIEPLDINLLRYEFLSSLPLPGVPRDPNRNPDHRLRCDRSRAVQQFREPGNA